MSAREPLLAVEDLRVQFWTSRGTVYAVNGISFDIARGETLGIVGESGCGKSVTALAILGILPRAGKIPTGTAIFEGRDLLHLSDRRLRGIRGREIAMIFQDPMTSLNPVLTIGKQIREELKAHFGMRKKEANERAIELLDRVGIPSPRARIKDYPHQFSGGMRQRAMIAMALACKPKLMIADEPTTALDVTIQAQILDLLRELVAEENAALIMITHDLGVVAGTCERVNVMYSGLFMETASASQLFANPRHPYTLGLLESVPAARRVAEDQAQADRGAAAQHARAAGGLPVPAALPLRGRALPQGGSAAGRDRAWPLRGLLQPGAGGGVGEDPRGGDGVSTNGALVRLEDLKVWFPIKSGIVLDRHIGDIKAVDGVTIDIHRGETLGLVGESGCGKSTVGRAILRLYKPTSGRIEFDGKDITNLGDGDLRPLRRQMQMVFQDPFASLNPRHSIARIVGEPIRGARPGRRGARLGAAGARAAADRRPSGRRGDRAIRTSSRAASASASASRARLRSTRTSSSPTSRSRRSTSPSRRRSSTCWSGSRTSSTSPTCSSRTTSPSSGTSPTGSRSCTSARSSRSRRPDELYENPLHPYTISLLSAVPIPDPEVELKRKPLLLAGDLPSPANPPSACRFHTRCPYIQETRCRDEVPELRPLAPRAHVVACHWAEQIKSGRDQAAHGEARLRPGHQRARL